MGTGLHHPVRVQVQLSAEVVRACMRVGLHHTEPAMVFVRLDDVIKPRAVSIYGTHGRCGVLWDHRGADRIPGASPPAAIGEPMRSDIHIYLSSESTFLYFLPDCLTKTACPSSESKGVTIVVG